LFKIWTRFWLCEDFSLSTMKIEQKLKDICGVNIASDLQFTTNEITLVSLYLMEK